MPKPQSTAQSSPRMWGCFYGFPVYRQIAQVFPTHVGVFPGQSHWDSVRPCLPHACGGVSLKPWHPSTVSPSSPRMWGCFLLYYPVLLFSAVFPTHVGVFLCSAGCCGAAMGLPHACGGVSGFRRHTASGTWSSPRMWGCFWGDIDSLLWSLGLPHACGGVSGAILIPCCGRLVFPTHVGVFLGRY